MANGTTPAYRQKEIILRLQNDARADIHAALNAIQAQDMGALQFMPQFHKVVLRGTVGMESALATLNATPGVKYAEPNYIYSTHTVTESQSYMPRDKKFKNQWSLRNTGQKYDFQGNTLKGKPGFDMHVVDAWNIDPSIKDAAAGIKVAVIDTGIDYNHRDLKDNVWHNPGENGAWEPASADEAAHAPKGCHDKSCNGIDDDGNGLVDDWVGWNWSLYSSSGQLLPGNNNPMDNNSHGTHVSGIIGAEHNGDGVAGVNNKVQLMALKFLDKDGSGTLEGAIQAVGYAIAMKADVINASWGGSGDAQALAEAVKDAGDHGIFFVAAAGNDSQDNDYLPDWPANFPFDNVLSVAASDPTGALAFFSNFGKQKVHVVAPGHMILSTVPHDKYEYMSGTSMAAPNVTGVVAMVLGTHPELRRKPAALKKWLIDSTDMSVPFLSKVYSGGSINAYNAVKGIFAGGHQRPDSDHWSAQVAYPIQSDHPYADNLDLVQEIHVPNAKWVRINFGRYSLESGVDNVEIYDAQGNLFDALSGFGYSATSAAVKGDTVKLVFRTDNHVTRWGFEVLGYQAQY